MTNQKPGPITRDQEFYSLILAELKRMNLQLMTIVQRLSDEELGSVCGICGRSFVNERALRAHMKAHKE